MPPFASSLEHIFAELERVDLFLQLLVHRLRRHKPADKFEGLYVSEQELDEHLARPRGLPRWANVAYPGQAEHDRRYVQLRLDLAARVHATAAAGVRMRLEDLVASSALTAFDRNVLLLCLAPEVEPRYERIFAYLQDDVTRRRPSVNLALDLLCPTLEDKVAMRARLEPGAALLRDGLVETFDEPTHANPTFLTRALRLAPRVAAFLLDSDALPPELDESAHLDPTHEPDGPVGSLAAQDALERFAARYDDRTGLVINIVGAAGSGKKAWARALCARLDLRLLVIHVRSLLALASPREMMQRLRLIHRERVLQRAALYYEGIDALDDEERRSLIEALLRGPALRSGLVIAGSARPWPTGVSGAGLHVARVELPASTHAARVEMWRSALPPDLAPAVVAELDAVATTFRFSGGQIHGAAADAVERARWRPDGPVVTIDDVYAACRARSNGKLEALARPIRPHYTWADIVLSPDAIGQLREMCARVRLRGLVHERWGFDQKLSLGKGVNVLFSGPSGTGKTMAAEVLARELNLSLYKIDLASVVSKYIGETEKNLAAIFAEAETSNAILFFDEADSLFGKRSEVKDSHDRYANIETSYLLQRMEDYAGVTILATNLRKNIDDAFVRRMTFMLAFSLPDEAERRRIWAKVWPQEAPLDPSVDLAFMAHQFKLSGANIKNIALAAAFLAASEGRPVGMRHLITGVKREMQKAGRVCVPGDFGEYAALAE